MNPFSVLGESDDEETPVKVAKQKKDTKNAVKPAAKPAVAAASTAAAAKPAENNNNSSKTSKASESKESKPKKDSKPKEKKTDASTETAAVAMEPSDIKHDAKRKKEIDRRRAPHGQEKPSFENGLGKKREFERHSGTGRGKEVAKKGSGKYGAGNPEEEAHRAEKDPLAAETSAEDEATTESPETESVPQAEPEPTTFTLDEYLAKRNEARSNSTIIGAPTRVVEVENAFAALIIKGDGVEDVLPATTLARAAAAKSKKDQRSTTKKSVTNWFQDSKVAEEHKEHTSRGRDGGRGRGRSDRAPGGRGERRQGGGKVDIFDASAFPTL